MNISHWLPFKLTNSTKKDEILKLGSQNQQILLAWRFQVFARIVCEKESDLLCFFVFAGDKVAAAGKHEIILSFLQDKMPSQG